MAERPVEAREAVDVAALAPGVLAAPAPEPLPARRTARPHRTRASARQRGTQRDAAPDRLLDVRDAAALLGVAPGTLYNWAYQRRIPKVKLLGGALRFRLSAILALIADSEQPALRDSPLDA